MTVAKRKIAHREVLIPLAEEWLRGEDGGAWEWFTKIPLSDV